MKDAGESFESATPVTVAHEELPEDLDAPVEQTAAPQGQNGSADPEEQVIGACLLDEGPTLDKAIAAGLTSVDFSPPRNDLIFGTLHAMRNRGVAIGLDTLVTELGPKLAIVGGIQHLMGLADPIKIPTTARAGHYIEVVRQASARRALIRNASELIERANLGEDLSQLLGVIERLKVEPPKAVSSGTPYTIWQPAAFRAFQPPPDMNLVGGGYVRRRQLTTLIGPPGVGKSRLSLWLACLHISGRPFMGMDCQNGPAKWLFFGNENDPMRQKHDLDWFYRNLTATEQAKVDANLYLHVIDKPDDGIITLADPDAYRKLCASLKQVQPDVVVFDPWGNMIEGNENDNEEVRRTLKLLIRAISENCPTAAIIVIHHARTGKATAIEAGNNYSGGSLGRGSKALVSSARCELALWPGDSEDSSKLVLTCEKANNVQKFEPKGLLFENGVYRQDDAFDLKAWRDDIEGNRSGKSISIKDLVGMVKDGCHKSTDITARAMDEFGVSRRTVFVRLAEACDAGYLAKCQPAGSYTLGKVK